MANPGWTKGGPSPNPEGRRRMKHSARTVKGYVERFVKRNFTPKRLQMLFDKLDAKDKLLFMVEVLPYIMPKQSSMTLKAQVNAMTPDELDDLYSRLLGPTDDAVFQEILSLPEPIKQQHEPRQEA